MTTLNQQYEEKQEDLKSIGRHLMAFVFGFLIPALLSTWDFPFLGIWISGVVFCIYAFMRQESPAATFGMFIAVVSAILIMGSVELADIEKYNQQVLVYPADTLH